MKLFLDLDGVLVNWCKGAHKLHGVPWTEGEWPYARGPKGWGFNKELGISNTALFKDMGYYFWKNLEWMLDGKEILSICEWHMKDDVFLLTSPCHTRGCAEGRLAWIEREMPEYRSKVLIGNCKYAVARKGAILVDDYDANLSEWSKNGGMAITCPRPWNTGHMIADAVHWIDDVLAGREVTV